ncbi:SCO family protein [Radiobacillus sp. PE A8.2]|uniref:SCO family protein n=1 Tax=Radiobacillus sp. PE A8.2 TaxID=3380349 RepID=UPI00388F0E31
MHNHLYKKLIVLLLLFVLTACGSKYEGDFSYNVQPFEFTNQDNQTVSNEDLEGKFWIADTIFTNCQTACPVMTANMVQLQERLQQEGLDSVEFVSFSIDPEQDTPEVLKEYGQVRGVDFSNWNFLTGYQYDEIKKFAMDSFKAYVDDAGEDDQFIHTSRFYLVTPEGNTIKSYDGFTTDQFDTIISDLKKMM